MDQIIIKELELYSNSRVYKEEKSWDRNFLCPQYCIQIQNGPARVIK